VFIVGGFMQDVIFIGLLIFVCVAVKEFTKE